MPSYKDGRYTFAVGPVSEEVKIKLVKMIKGASGKDVQGFRTVNRLLDRFISEYESE